MKAQIIIEYEGDFDEQDLKDEVKLIEEDILSHLGSEDEPKWDEFKVSYNILEDGSN